MKEIETEKGTEQRTAFYIRVETDKEIRITWRTIPLNLPYMWLILYLFFGYLSNTVSINARTPFALMSGICFVTFFVYAFIMFMSTRDISREIKAAMREGPVGITGNKRSLTDPLTDIIKKDVKSC